MNEQLVLILPELVLTGGLCLLLLSDLILQRRRIWETGVFSLGLLGVVAYLVLQRFEASPQDAFGGLLCIDRFSALFQLVISVAAGFAIFLNLQQYRFPEDRGRIETQFLFLCAALGGFVLVGTQHLMMLYLGLEMVGLCSYALADVHKRDRAGAEASMKYVVYGALSSGVMLYGISLLFGLGGASFAMPDIALGINQALVDGEAVRVLLPSLLLLAGFLFKLALVPFHWWAPDVYQGTTIAMAGFLAVGSKLVAFGALLRTLGVLFATSLHGVETDMDLAVVTAAASEYGAVFGMVLAALATVSMLWGNLAAVGQTHLLRLLAYSSIGHAGYLLAAIALMSPDGFTAAGTYALIYGVASLGAFAAVFAIAMRAGSKDLCDWAGLGWKYPLAAGTLVVFFASLTGLPPTAGFAGKWRLLMALWAGGAQGLALLIALLSVVSLFYYFRVIKQLYLERPEDNFMPAVSVRLPWLTGFLLIVSFATFALLNLSWVEVPVAAATADLIRG
ncbi:MAG: NADH-quinone oxidoreductase subunit N [Planctomycetes bacterium]|nr:NADH-quinone oxidoreductase subunit N [Planctomycetota bacterium]